MSTSFFVRSSWLTNLLLSFLIEYFFFWFSCLFTNFSIQSVVASKYFLNLIVVVLRSILVELILFHYYFLK